MADDAYRMILCQNNAKRTVKIKEVTESLAQLLGYMRSEIEGREFLEFSGVKLAQSLDELLEYESDSDDVGDVLARQREVKLRPHKGEEIPFAHKCLRDTPKDEHSWFQLHLKDERRQIEEQSLTSLLRENLAGVIALDEPTGLADRTTCARYLDQVAHYVSTHEAKACFAVLRLDRYQKSLGQYGKSGCDKLIQHVANHCKGKFREEDLVSFLGEDRIGLLLMDASGEAARIVLNRLRAGIAAHRLYFGEKQNFSVTVSIAFAEMLGESGEDTMKRVEQAIDGIALDERSQFTEAAL